MSSTLSHALWRLRRRSWVRLALVALALASAPMATRAAFHEAQAPAAVPASKGDVRPAIGDWRSREQLDNQPRATVVVQEDAGTLAGSLTLLGLTNGADDRATLRVPFRGAQWDGTTLTFETVLPDEGTSRWTLRLLATGRATLALTAEDGKPIEQGPSWDMLRQ